MNAKTKTTLGSKFLSVMLSVMLTLSVTLCAGAPVSVQSLTAFYGGQRIFFDVTAIASRWLSDGQNYPYMHLSGNSADCWISMSKAAKEEGLVLTGSVPNDGNTYDRLIFTSQTVNDGNADFTACQTTDITWNGTGNFFIPDSADYTPYSLSGTWTTRTTTGDYAISTDFSAGAAVTVSADNRTAGTAYAGDIVTVTVNLNGNYSLDSVTVKGKKTQYEVTEINSSTFTFQMPEEKVTVKANCIFDKSHAFSGSVFWVDTQPSVTDSSLGLVKWTNRTGNGSRTSGIYTLYLPSGVDMSALPVYFGTGSININGDTVAQGQPYSFTEGQVYTINGYQMQIMQSDSASVYLQTPRNLDIGIINPYADASVAAAYKENTRQTNGQFMSVGKDGTVIDQPQLLAQIKGRGNSSWEASYRCFGKYSYNIKLGSKADVLNMGAVKAKSFCLLANNCDESMLRNVEVYQAAAMAGLGYVPHYEIADVYNNGEYLGSYLVTEKVDVGKSKLVQGETVEDYHNDPSATGRTASGSYDFNGRSYRMQYTDTGAIDDGVDYTKKSYLLEFDLKARAMEENCWFVTPQGQFIVVKSPDSLNMEEMSFIAAKWAEAEYAVYSNAFDTMNSLMDLSSFADVYLIQEFTKNLDSCATSYYVYYDGTQKNPKWQAAPIWDYDWTLGGYQNGYLSKKIVNGDYESNNVLANTDGWFAKYKSIIISDNNQPDVWNLQAKLCNNSTFWNNHVITAWNSHMYSALQDVFSSKIDTDYQAHSKSFAMNEARYGFIASNPIANWGSVDTGNTPFDAYAYLRNWGYYRMQWMHARLQREFSGISLSADKTMAAAGDTVTLTATPYPSYTENLTYDFSVNGTPIRTTTEKSITFTVPEQSDRILNFQVSAGGYTSDPVSVTVVYKVDAIEPTCTHAGNIEYYTDGTKFYILKKGSYKEITQEETVLPVTAHSYREPEWHWTSGYSSAYAVFVCESCGYPQHEDANLVTSYDNDGNPVYTAYVYFNDEEYSDEILTKTVSFDSNGGSHVNSQTVVVGETAETPDTPTREGYTFDGWYLNGESYDFDSTVMENITLTAHWRENITYTPVPAVAPTCTENGHILYYEGSDGKLYLLDNGIYTETTVENVTLPAGHDFASPVWDWAEDHSTASAVFICTVCSTRQTRNAAVTSETTEPTYETNGQTVYTATVDWNGQRYSDTQTVIIPKKEYTLVVINCIDINGITTSQTVPAETFTEDGFTVPANPYLDGYTFQYWTVNGTVYEDSNAVRTAVFALVSAKTAEPIEVRTVYEKNAVTHTVNVEVGGAFSDNSVSKEFLVSDIVTVIANKQSPEQAFTCWKRGEKIVSYDKTYSFFMPDEDITLTAIYEGGPEEMGIAFIENVKIDQENGKLSFISICGVPEQCKMQSAGLIADTDISHLAAFETARFKRLSDKVTENTKSLKYTWTVGGVKDTTVLYVRSYVSYKDSNGDMRVVLGDIVTATLDGWQIEVSGE